MSVAPDMSGVIYSVIGAVAGIVVGFICQWAKPAEPAESVTLTVGQLKDAIDMVGEVGPGEDEWEVTITWMSEWTDRETKEVQPAGYYAYYTEYPEEGLYGPLANAPQRKAKQ